MGKQAVIFVISGPSGSGKTTLLERLLKNKHLKTKVLRSVSFTTRPKRPGERQARDYFFISEREFREKQKTKKILEWTRYLGYYYGTFQDFFAQQLKRGKHILLCLDLKGALKIKQLYPKNTVTIFILPPSLEELHHRIESRGHKSQKEEILRRLKLARQEVLTSSQYDYCVVNQDLRQAVKKLREILHKEISSCIGN